MGFVIIGFLSGIISGMGIGGGALLIPALTFIYGMNQQAAQNINLLYFLPTASVALVMHRKKGNIETKGLARLIMIGLLGAMIGAIIAVRMDAVLLRRCFGFFLLAMGTYELFGRGGKESGSKSEKQIQAY